MRRVVLDPELLATGLLSRDDMHKLLGLFAYGRWAQYANLFGASEEGVLDKDLQQGWLRKGPSKEQLVELARDRAAALGEQVPHGIPDDLVLVASSRIHDAVLERVQLARQLDPDLRSQTDLVEQTRLRLVFLTAILVDDIGGEYERTESLRDHLIRVAADTNAALVTDDHELARADGRMWRHSSARGGKPAIAVTSWTFIDSNIDQATIGLADVPTDLLRDALRASAAAPDRSA